MISSARPLCLTLAFLSVLAGSASAEGIEPRLRIRFDANWKFRRNVDEAPRNAPGPFAWQWKRAETKSIDISSLPSDLASGEWRETKDARNVMRGDLRFAWFRTDLGQGPLGDRQLHFDSIDDNAVVFLNGVKVGGHTGYGDEFDVPLAAHWRTDGPNALVVLVENTGGEGGLSGGISLQSPAGPATTPEEAKPGFADRDWRTVHVPHDYVVEGTFRQGEDVGHGSLPKPTAWYRKTFTPPASYQGKSVWIDFDGVYRNSAIYLNGVKLGPNQASGYIGFRYDIGAKLKYGQPNVLAVHVDPRRDEGWWYEGGGIYRHVWLNVSDPVHLKPWHTYVRTNIAGPMGKDNPQTSADLGATVVNDSDRSQNVTVVSRILDASGKLVATATASRTIPAHGESDVTQTTPWWSAKLWSLERPYLYRLVNTIKLGDKVVDAESTSFGVRSFRFDPNLGFFLNGKPVKLKGTCNHQDHAGVGIAMPDGLLEWRIRKLKEMGSNAYRCSHNPPAEELIEACDRLGMLVMDETRHLGNTALAKSPPGTKPDDLTELESLVRRDRNHPSVIMWSLFNEEPLQATDEGAQIFLKEKTLVDRLDPTRPCTGASNFGYGAGIQLVTDLYGFNYNIGAYDEAHRKFPYQALFGSETASTVGTRGIYTNDAVRGYVSAYDLNHPSWAETAEHAWRPIAERPWMAGAFVWTGFDYKGEPTPYEWPCVNSHFGILDICGFPKDNFYYYKAWWGDAPVVHVLPHWNWPGQEGKPIAVWVQSNADEVELFLNGKSLGRKSMPRYGHLEWEVAYAPGEVKAVGYRAGKTIATDTVATTGAPAAIRLKTTRARLLADDEDISPVEVEIVDAKGRVVPTASNEVEFEVTGMGEVVGVGNGDPSDHDPDKAAKRKAFNGLCMALVGAKGQPGKIVLTAKAAGLKSATLTLTTLSAEKGQ